METRADYKLDGNMLQLGLQLFTIESITDKEIRLLETQAAYPARHILIPTDSFTTAKRFSFTVNSETSDTVYTSVPGIEPYYKPDNFIQAVLTGITETAAIEFEYVVQKDGNIGEVTIISSTSQSVNNRFIKMVKKTSGNWMPGVLNGKPVSVKCRARVWRQRSRY